MTRVNYIESLHQFFTEKRVDIALRLLSSDHSVQDVIAGARNVNIHGNNNNNNNNNDNNNKGWIVYLMLMGSSRPYP